MHSILNVLVNRAAKKRTSIYEEVLRPEQFSSMTTPGDGQLGVGPNALNVPDWSAFLTALSLAADISAGLLPDITGGSTLYYAPASIAAGATITLPDGSVVPFPKGWNPAVVTYQCEIAGQLFFTE